MRTAAALILGLLPSLGTSQAIEAGSLATSQAIDAVSLGASQAIEDVSLGASQAIEDVSSADAAPLRDLIPHHRPLVVARPAPRAVVVAPAPRAAVVFPGHRPVPYAYQNYNRYGHLGHYGHLFRQLSKKKGRVTYSKKSPVVRPFTKKSSSVFVGKRLLAPIRRPAVAVVRPAPRAAVVVAPAPRVAVVVPARRPAQYGRYRQLSKKKVRVTYSKKAPVVRKAKIAAPVVSSKTAKRSAVVGHVYSKRPDACFGKGCPRHLWKKMKTTYGKNTLAVVRPSKLSKKSLPYVGVYSAGKK